MFTKNVSFNFCIQGKNKNMIMKLPTLFIIGDTEGHISYVVEWLAVTI